MIKSKKIVSSILFALILTGCNYSSGNLLTDITQPGLSALSTLAGPVEGDERGGVSSLNTGNGLSGIKLPVMPSIDIFAAFNNDYKGLYADNEVIAHADPKNTDKYLFSLIKSAKTTIDAAIFDIDDPDSVNALIEAKKRGVTIRIVTDGDNLKDKVNTDQPRSVIENLKAAGIPVHDDGTRSDFMHNKFIIVDNKWVWTGSYNLTTNAMYRDNNNIVLVNSPELAANYNAEFTRLFVQGLFGVNPHEMPNPVINLPDATISTFFSPGGGTKAAIMTELGKATKSIKFMAFSFTDQDMANIFIEKSKTPGFQVEGVLDSCEISQYSIFDNLKKNNIWVKGDGNQALMHHKTMIIDDTTVITGSFNFSKSAEDGNNENTLIIKSKTLAKIFDAEYNRIKYAAIHNTNLPPYDHPACQH